MEIAMSLKWRMVEKKRHIRSMKGKRPAKKKVGICSSHIRNRDIGSTRMEVLCFK